MDRIPKKKCENCNSDFQPKARSRRYCSRECGWEALKKPSHVSGAGIERRECRFCGSEFNTSIKTKVYCSKSCRRSVSNVSRGRSSGKKEYGCKECGSVFEKPYSKGRPPAYCSEECRAKSTRCRYKPIGVAPRICDRCGKDFRPSDPFQAHCSDSCLMVDGSVKRSMKRRAMQVVEMWEPRQPKYSVVPCRYCGVEFRSEFPASVVCGNHQCRKRHADDRAAVRRARKIGNGYEVVDLVSILDRDSWSCRACGCDTPKELRGKNHPRAPEVDHIIPLAKGGSHTRGNMQCLCRSCNLSKGAK